MAARTAKHSWVADVNEPGTVRVVAARMASAPQPGSLAQNLRVRSRSVHPEEAGATPQSESLQLAQFMGGRRTHPQRLPARC